LGVIFVVNLAYVWNHVGVPFKCTIIKRCNMWLQNICGEMVSRSENWKMNVKPKKLLVEWTCVNYLIWKIPLNLFWNDLVLHSGYVFTVNIIHYKIMFPYLSVCDCDDVMLIFSPSLGFESQ
jgi:hypothetical protein